MKKLDEILKKLKTDMLTLLKEQKPVAGKSRGSLSDSLREAIQADIEDGYTMKDIAESCGIALPILTRWSNGERASIKIETIEKLMSHYGMRVVRD